MSSLTWIFSFTLLLLLLPLHGTGSSEPPAEEPSSYTISVELDDSNSSATANTAKANWTFHNHSGVLDIEANLTSILGYALDNNLSVKLGLSSENKTLFRLEKCQDIIFETAIENSTTEVVLGQHLIAHLLELAGTKCSFENFDFFVVISSDENSNGNISIQSAKYLLPTRSENTSDQVVHIDQHFRKNVIHQVDLDGLVDTALSDTNELTLFMVANLSKPAEIHISKCGVLTIRLNTTVNETVEFTKDQLERLKMITDLHCLENMNSTFIDISVKCEERINGTLVFGLHYPKTHMTVILCVVSVVAVAVIVFLLWACKELGCGWREGNTNKKNRQRRLRQGKYGTNKEKSSETDGTEEAGGIVMGEVNFGTFKFVPKGVSTVQVQETSL